jgi:hypothetical protein
VVVVVCHGLDFLDPRPVIDCLVVTICVSYSGDRGSKLDSTSYGPG